MALPSFEKTWEFSLFHFIDNRISAITTDEIAGQYMSVALLNVMTDTKKKAWGGTFTDQGSGTVRFAPTTVGGWPYGPTGQELYDSTDVGLKIVFVGCNSAGNDGTFTITAVDTSAGAWVEFTNSGTPVFEVDTACSAKVLWGNFTVPLTLKGSSGSVAGRGAGMDGKDRWLSPADIVSNSSGNRDWFVVETSNGLELLFWHHCTSASYNYEMAFIGLSENGYTGGTINTKPTVTDEIEEVDGAHRWGPHVDPNGRTFYFFAMMSNDGAHFRLWSLCDAYDGAGLFVGMEPAKNPVIGGALIPWNGNNNVCWWASCAEESGNSDRMTYTHFWSQARIRAVIDKDASAGGPYYPAMAMTTECDAASSLGQTLDIRSNGLTPASVFFWPIGFASNDTNIKGRLGRLADIWFSPDAGVQMRWGATFSSAGSKTFIRIGDFILPWDGSSSFPRRAPSGTTI